MLFTAAVESRAWALLKDSPNFSSILLQSRLTVRTDRPNLIVRSWCLVGSWRCKRQTGVDQEFYVRFAAGVSLFWELGGIVLGASVVLVIETIILLFYFNIRKSMSECSIFAAAHRRKSSQRITQMSNFGFVSLNSVVFFPVQIERCYWWKEVISRFLACSVENHLL